MTETLLLALCEVVEWGKGKGAWEDFGDVFEVRWEWVMGEARGCMGWDGIWDEEKGLWDAMRWDRSVWDELRGCVTWEWMRWND